jgi:hypothetical protein
MLAARSSRVRLPVQSYQLRTSGMHDIPLASNQLIALLTYFY